MAIDEDGGLGVGSLQSAAIQPASPTLVCGTNVTCFEFTGTTNLTHVGVEGTPCGTGDVEVQVDGGAWIGTRSNTIRQQCNLLGGSASLFQFVVQASPGSHNVCFSNIDVERVHALHATASCESEDASATCPSCAVTSGTGGSGGAGGAGGAEGAGGTGTGGTGGGQIACSDAGPAELNRCFTDTGINPWGHYEYDHVTGLGHYLQGGTLLDPAATHPADRNNPDNAVGGGPTGNFFNLGVNGWIKLAFPVVVPEAGTTQEPRHELQILSEPGASCDPTSPLAEIWAARGADANVAPAESDWVFVGHACGEVTRFDLACLAADPDAADLLANGIRFVKVLDVTGQHVTSGDSAGFVLDLVGGLTCP